MKIPNCSEIKTTLINYTNNVVYGAHQDFYMGAIGGMTVCAIKNTPFCSSYIAAPLVRTAIRSLVNPLYKVNYSPINSNLLKVVVLVTELGLNHLVCSSLGYKMSIAEEFTKGAIIPITVAVSIILTANIVTPSTVKASLKNRTTPSPFSNYLLSFYL